MADIKLEDYVPEVKEALDQAMAEHITETQGLLFKKNPASSGRMASSWFISKDQPEQGARPENWAEPGAMRLEQDEYPKSQIEFDGTWYISNNVPYAERVALDDKYSKGGDGGTAWYTSVLTQQAADFSASAIKFLRRVG